MIVTSLMLALGAGLALSVVGVALIPVNKTSSHSI